MAFDWKSVLSKVAPTAATLLSGPFAGLAIKSVGDALGLPDATTQQIQTALVGGQLTGDQIVALKKAEIDVQQHLADNGIQLEAIMAGDRDSARKRQIATGDWMPSILAILIISMTALAEGALIAGYEPRIAPELVGRILGTLDSACSLVLMYFFGTNSQSRQKTELLAQSTPKE